MKKSEAFGLVIEDNTYESLKPDLVDFAFGAGVVSYLNITGLNKPEKSTKVARFGEILQTISQIPSSE
jgi:hypothetical protein